MSLRSSCSFRRFGLGDERRRRLLTDEPTDPSDWSAHRAESGDASSQQKPGHYGDARFLEQVPRLFDLIPCRMLSLVLLLATGIIVLLSLLAAYAWILGRVANGHTMVAALDLGAKGSLGCWFSSLLLLVGAVSAILIYTIRRHRIDDYQGRYRIWLWAAACWFFMATDQAASLREGFRDLMIAVTGTPLIDNGDFWWVILYTLMLGAVGSRLLVDMYACTMATSAAIGAAVVYFLAVAVRLDWILPPVGDHKIIFISGAEMTGCLMLSAAMILFARHVLLDAKGLLPCRKSEQDEDSGETDDATTCPSSNSESDRWRKIDLPHPTPQPVFQRTVASQPVTASTPSPVNRKLTKAEKKALKERLLRERRERERSR